MRQLLATLVLCTAVPLLILAALMLHRLVQHERLAVRTGLMSNASSLAALVDKEVDMHVAIASTLATSFALESGDLGTFRIQAERVLTVVPGTWISLIDPAGDVVMTTLPGVTLTKQPRLLSNRLAAVLIFPVFKAGVVYGPARSSLDLNQCRLGSGSRTKAQQGHLGASSLSQRGWPWQGSCVSQYSILMGLDPDRFQRLIRDKYGGRTVVAIIDRQRRFVARDPGQETRLGTLASTGWRAALDRSPEGVAEYPTVEGTPSLQAYLTTREGWAVGIAYPTELLEGPVRLPISMSDT